MTERIEDLSVVLMYEGITDKLVCSELHKWCRLIAEANSQTDIECFFNRGMRILKELLDSGTHMPGNICVAEQILFAAKNHSLALKVTQEMQTTNFPRTEGRIHLH